VTVFSFARCQGFTSVPSRGGCSLGMVQRHCHLRTYTLAEFAAEQRLLRREKLQDRLRQEKLEALRLKVSFHSLLPSLPRRPSLFPRELQTFKFTFTLRAFGETLLFKATYNKYI